MIGCADKVVIGFYCEPLVGLPGYTWTLTSLLSKFLVEAERRYGPRDPSYTPLGIEFCRDGPMVWYPGDRRHISIMLSESASTDPARAIFQLAHEVVHLLSPTGVRNAPIFEEGLATLFADEMAAAEGSWLRNEDIHYNNAAVKVRQFIEQNPDGVRSIRMEEPSFTKFTPDLILRICPQTSEELANSLCLPFTRG